MCLSAAPFRRLLQLPVLRYAAVKIARSSNPRSTLYNCTLSPFNQQSRRSCPGTWSDQMRPLHTLSLNGRVLIRTVTFAGISAGLEGMTKTPVRSEARESIPQSHGCLNVTRVAPKPTGNTIRGSRIASCLRHCNPAWTRDLKPEAMRRAAGSGLIAQQIHSK